ncbi:MAG: hypothetical protein AAF202_01935 [Pseudomonadota bacterium]
MDKQLRKFDKALVKDFNMRSEAYKVLIESGADASQAPYPQMNQLLSEMKTAKEDYQGNKSKFQKIKSEMLALIKGKKKIKSDQPEFQRIENFREQADQYNGIFEKDSKAYSRASKEFNKLMKTNDIYKVDVKKLKSQVDSQFKKMNKGLKKAQDVHNKNKKRAQSSPKKLAILKEVDANIEQMKTLGKEAELVAQAFVSEVGKQKTAFVAQHMKSHSVLTELKSL